MNLVVFSTFSRVFRTYSDDDANRENREPPVHAVQQSVPGKRDTDEATDPRSTSRLRRQSAGHERRLEFDAGDDFGHQYDDAARQSLPAYSVANYGARGDLKAWLLNSIVIYYFKLANLFTECFITFLL